MRFPIRPGKVTCAGLVGIMMVLPNSIWQSPNSTPNARVQIIPRSPEIEDNGPISSSGLEIPESALLSSRDKARD